MGSARGSRGARKASGVATPDLRDAFGALDIYLFDQLLRGRVAPGGTVLDAGCGTGRNLVYFIRAGHRVLGADADPAAVAEVRRLAAELAPAAVDAPADAFRAEPVEATTFPDAVADVVVSSAVLHFARDGAHFDAMLRGTWRVLRPGGILFCRLAGLAGLEGLAHPLGHGRYALPDGTERFLADERMLRAATDALGGELLDPIKTTVVHGRRAMMTWVLRRTAATVLAAGALAAAAPRLPGARPLAAQPAPRVTVDAGTLQGARDSASGVLLFRGIPYAAPPVGPLRFRPPAPPAHWTGVRPAAALGHNCMQGQPYSDIDPYAAGVSEDCLYLNVATTDTAGPPRPVMVWIHGGGFGAGFGGEERHNPVPLARKGAVVVTLNYRLGPFGFLAHPALAAESPHHSAGDYGLLDQVAALEWVRRNARRFGGDSARVTIFGESAGGFSVGALVASPLARGLFQRAILQSGTGIGAGVAPRDSALAEGERFATERLGVAPGPDAAARLRALPADSILRASHGNQSPAPRATVDGWVLPRSVDSALAQGRANLVPAIVGSNRDEPAAVFGAPARSFARLLTAHGVPAYVYQFTRAAQDDSAARARGAYHSADITFAFGRPRPIQASAGHAAYDSTLAETMSDYWVAFAATGDPNGPLPVARPNAAPRPRWPRYSPATDASLELGSAVAARERVRAPEYDALDAAGRARGEVRP